MFVPEAHDYWLIASSSALCSCSSERPPRVPTLAPQCRPRRRSTLPHLGRGHPADRLDRGFRRQDDIFQQALVRDDGYAGSSGLDSGWIEVVHPDDRDPCRQKWQESASTGGTFEVEYRLRNAKQEFRWYLDRAVPLRNDSGAIEQWFGTCTDIDDKVHTQQVLEEQVKQHTAALIDANLRLETEIRERTLAQQEFQEQSGRMVRELTARSRRATTLAKTAELLESCADMKDIFSVVSGMAPQIFPELRGAVFLFNASRDSIELAESCSERSIPAKTLRRQDCWALRTGHLHLVVAREHTIGCPHAGSPAYSYFCLPLLSQGDPIGVLHLQMIGAGELPEPLMFMVNMFAEQVGLSAANLRLREELRNQSIRDPLTGLFNRRHLEEALDREVRHAARAGQYLGLVMLDLDHFKKFNDTYGHEAGAAVLRETASFLARSVRAEDVICRFGGEEFVIIFLLANLHATTCRAEQSVAGCTNSR